MERTTHRAGRPAAPKPDSSPRTRSVGRAGSPPATPPPSDTSTMRRTSGSEGGGSSGMGLGAKFALFIALTVAIASSVLVVASYFTAAKQMDEEIDAAGIRQIKVIGAYALNEIKKHRISEGKDLAAELDSDVGKLFPFIPEGSRDQARPIDDRIKKNLKKVDEIFKTKALSYLSPAQAKELGLDAPGVINISINIEESGQLQSLQAMNDGTISLSKPISRDSPDKGVKIEEGLYGGTTRARIYKKDVIDERGATIGNVHLYLSARKIDDAKSAILTALLLPLLLAIVIGAGIGFYLSTIVTKPLKTLITDINQVSAGDLEHETKAQSTDEIGYLAKTFNLMTKSLATAHEAELANKAMEHELNIATEIQAQLLPHRIPKIPGLELGAYYRPSKEVGGDYYDFIQIDQNHLGLIVADVSGKGVPGSMVMTMARSLIRMEAERNLSTADTLVKTNRILARDIRRGMFVTCLYALMDVRTRTLLVSSAGHNPMVVYRKATNKYELINPNGIALGFDKGPIFERTIKEQQVPLHPGDRVMLYTDGVVEAMDSKNVEFGDERFYKMVQLLAEKDSNVFINTIVKALDEHKGEAPQHDDITLVTVRVLPQG